MNDEQAALLAKLGFFALDQIGKYVELVQKAQSNKTMTKEEMDKLIRETQEQARNTVAEWDEFFKGS